MITVVDYGMGNIGSVENMIRHCGGESVVASSPEDVASADKLILPGVGAFDAGMQALHRLGLDAAVRTAVLDNSATILGICLGMQLLLEESEEGSSAGLGLIKGRARLLAAQQGVVRVPHMGWNRVRPVRSSTIFPEIEPDLRFYFVHSYFAECDDPSDVCAESDYGVTFASALERGRVMGVQFHPEKSHRYGMAIFRRYIEL